MDFETQPYLVLVKTNASGYITAVNSSAFLTDTEGWVEIDSGFGDKFYHAQNNYFPKRIMTYGYAYLYKLVDGVPVECAADEIARQEETRKPKPTPTLESRVKTLEDDTADLSEALEMLLSGVIE